MPIDPEKRKLITIEIRHAELDDAQAIHDIYTQPKVVHGTLQLPCASTERYRKRLAESQEGSYSLLACIEGEVVGHLHLRTYPNSPRRKHAGTLGMAVSTAWHGKGVGSALMEAAVHLAEQWLNLTRLELSVFTDNEPAIRLYKKFGFISEGELKSFAFRDGQMADVHFMARIKGEEEPGL